MQTPYCQFAKVYDLFMDNVDYESWAERIIDILKEHGIHDGLILDLGCGTGTMTQLLADAGYDMIGLDSSEEMLAVAMEKKLEADTCKNDILYLCQDVRDFELYGTVRAIVCVCDVINYVLEEEELLEVFRLVSNYLDPGGLFIFDTNTPYKYEQIMGDQVIAENREEGSFIWENSYDLDEELNYYDLTLFLKREDGLYEKESEEHIQRSYTPETIAGLLKESGLQLLGTYDDYTENPVGPTSERITWLAREIQKKQPEQEEKL